MPIEAMATEPDPAGDLPSARDALIANEQIKYNATFINGIAVAVFAVGGIAPFVGALTTGRSSLTIAVMGFAGIGGIASFILHWIVLRLLRRLTA